MYDASRHSLFASINVAVLGTHAHDLLSSTVEGPRQTELSLAVESLMKTFAPDYLGI